MFKVTKLNRKYTGYGDFMYAITVEMSKDKTYTYTSLHNKRQEWFALREWCWETWGGSKEIEDWLRVNNSNTVNKSALVSQNSHWAWQNDKYACRIYLATDKELNWFKLRWEQ